MIEDHYKKFEPQKHNPARRLIIKVLINSLFGKCIQRIFDKENFILT